MKIHEEYIVGVFIGAFCGALYQDATTLQAIKTGIIILLIQGLIMLVDFIWNLVKHAFKSYMHREEVN